MSYQDVIKQEIQALYPDETFNDEELDTMTYQLLDFFTIMVKSQHRQNLQNSTKEHK